MIIQGTTPTHAFELPFDSELVSKARFVYSQGGEVVCIKTGADVSITPEGVSTTLTQEDTFAFTPDVQIKLLLRILTTGGDALVSEDPVWFLCRGCECKEIM